VCCGGLWREGKNDGDDEVEGFETHDFHRRGVPGFRAGAGAGPGAGAGALMLTAPDEVAAAADDVLAGDAAAADDNLSGDAAAAAAADGVIVITDTDGDDNNPAAAAAAAAAASQTPPLPISQALALPQTDDEEEKRLQVCQLAETKAKQYLDINNMINALKDTVAAAAPLDPPAAADAGASSSALIHPVAGAAARSLDASLLEINRALRSLDAPVARFGATANSVEDFLAWSRPNDACDAAVKAAAERVLKAGNAHRADPHAHTAAAKPHLREILKMDDVVGRVQVESSWVPLLKSAWFHNP
jgi:hypothetical protein